MWGGEGKGLGVPPGLEEGVTPHTPRLHQGLQATALGSLFGSPLQVRPLGYGGSLVFGN